MAKEIKVPDIGVTDEKVVLLKWIKEVGQDVKRGDIICELQTDKAVTELESVAEGVVLKQLAEVEQELSTGDIIAYVGQEGENID